MDATLPPSGEIAFRYEDFAQDGRPLMRALAPALGAVWRHQVGNDEGAAKVRAAGIVPILTRIEMELTEDSFSPFAPGQVSGRGDLLAADVAPGEHARVLFDIRARVDARTGHALLPRGESQTRTVGTLLGEHVLTRLFAKEGERRVDAAQLAALGVQPASSRTWEPPQSIVVPRPGLVPEGGGFVRDAVPFVFGLVHTDANQHVNSLVYPQLFEEAVLRRLRALGRNEPRLARSLVIGYRKPSFAGETTRIDVALFAGDGGRVTALGRFSGEGEDDPARARVYVRLEL